MKKIKLLQLIQLTLLLTVSSALFAQDVFRSAGTSSRSYRYVEAQYLLDSGVDNPYIVSAYYSLSDKTALRFSYFRVAGSIPDIDGAIAATVEQTLIGGVYFKPFAYLKETDWIAGVDVGQIKVAASRGVDRASSSETAVQLSLGLRKSVGPKLEVQGSVGFIVVDGDTDESIDVVAVYRIGQFLDAAVGILGVGDGDQIGLGLRYTW